MAGLHELYRINEINLSERRTFVGLADADVAVLAKLAGWAGKAAPKLASAFYDHQFAFAPTRAFFADYATTHGRSLDQLRVGLERAQGMHLVSIFEEAAGGGHYGVDYFERRLAIGQLHNHIDLPLKWYLGSYVLWADLVHARLRRDYPTRALLRRRAERALGAVFNLDIQAIVESFYYDTFATMGLDLAAVAITDEHHDLSNYGSVMKSTVRDTLVAVCKATVQVHEASGQLASSSDEAGRAVGEIATAMGDVAMGAERQVVMVESVRGSADAVAQAATESAESAQETVRSAEELSLIHI